MATGIIRTIVRVATPNTIMLNVIEGMLGPRIRAPNTKNATIVRRWLTASEKSHMSGYIERIKLPNVSPATKAAMKPDPPTGSATANATSARIGAAIRRQSLVIQPRPPANRIATAPSQPMRSPATTARPISVRKTDAIPRAVCISLAAPARAIVRKGTAMPSFRPLSTLRPCRTIAGTDLSVTTAWPRAASVGARMIAMMAASQNPIWSKKTRAASTPEMIVRGSPIPSSRPGRNASCRTARTSMTAASENSTITSVPSRRSRTNPLSRFTEIRSRACGPTINPNTMNSIGPVTDVVASRLETKA